MKLEHEIYFTKSITSTKSFLIVGNWAMRYQRHHAAGGFSPIPFLYAFGTFSRYFHKNAAKLTKSKKGFKNRVVTTFNAKLPLFGDHFWAFIPNLHQMKTSIYLRSHLLTSTFQLA